MAANSALYPDLISIRIVHIDHYLHPLRDYSSSISFQAARLTSIETQTAPKLPVIRIFGATPAGQRACLHIHGVRPYLYLPLPSTVSSENTLPYTRELREQLENCLRAAYTTDAPADDAPEQQPRFIADIEPVLKKNIYGYTTSPQVFLKVSTFNPRTIQRIANIVSQRALPSSLHAHTMHPFESHIPFYMQFLIDYSLSGMGYITLSAAKFRPPLPPAQHRDVAASFAARAVDRLFLHGLEVQQPQLFWPFHVARRSNSELELDAFPHQIIDVSANSCGNEYSFLSKTLTLLWEEERLRTGKYPHRKEKKERPVTAGAKLNLAHLVEKLGEVVHTQNSHSQSCEDNDVDMANEASDCVEAFAPTQGASAVSSQYDDLLAYLDANGGSKVSFDPQLSVEDVDQLHPREDEQERENGDDSDDDCEVIERTWKDIADCTQSTSHSNGEHPDTADGDTDGQEGKAGSPEDCDIEQAGNENVSTELPKSMQITTPGKRMRLMLPSSQEFVVAEEVPSQDHLVVNTNPSGSPLPVSAPGSIVPSSKNLKGTTTFIRPSERPPLFSSINGSVGKHEALSITYRTPYYSKAKDVTKSAQVYGGVILKIRGPGASGYEPFPPSFNTARTNIEVLPRWICPVVKPPLASSLLYKNPTISGKSPKRGRERIDIDSAGREIRRDFNETLRESGSASGGGFMRLTPRSHDMGEMDGKERSMLSTPSSLPNNSQLQNSGKTDNDYEHNRPLSPKYDEAFQLRANPVMDSVVKRRDQSYRRRTLSETPRSEKNSSISLSESPHSHQNIVTMSVEVLASSHSEKFPDPGRNAILAVCVATKKDRRDATQAVQEPIVFAQECRRELSDCCCPVIKVESEMHLLDALAAHMRKVDPDILVGFETQNASIGYILERSLSINHQFGQLASRLVKSTGAELSRGNNNGEFAAAVAYYHRKGADVKIIGRHVMSLWRIVRKEVKLSAYSREAVGAELFHTTFPCHKNRDIEDWFRNDKSLPRAIQYLVRITLLNVAIIDKLNVISRTGELGRVFGIDFMSVHTRGSQFRVESMLARVAHAKGFLLLAAQKDDVFRQPAVEALPLVIEPLSALYVDPVIVLDFQSLYPSVVIAHNLCYSTMMGNLNRISRWSEVRRVGVVEKYSPPQLDDSGLDTSKDIFVASNGEMFATAEVQRGILPQLLEELLETRVMVKTALKETHDDDVTTRLLQARQFGLKMIANVTYGYTSASFSGRMPCAGLADAIVQCGRDSLETIIGYVEDVLRPECGATVVYGDTDSLFVQVPGATRDEAFTIGEKIVSHAASIFADPITLKLEKVYQPCVLQTKKRYVGYSYESRTQAVPIFDAKGIETVRRDSCPLVQTALEKSLRILFESKDISSVKQYVQRLCQRLHTDRIPFSQYIFRKEVKLGSYKEGHMPPAAIVATKSMEYDSRAVPRHGERVAFVVLYGGPGAPLKDCVVAPDEYILAAQQGMARLNTTYYITKQVLPALDRVLSLVGVKVAVWYAEMPRRLYEPFISADKQQRLRTKSKQSSLHMFYATEKCAICHGKGIGQQLCRNCLSGEAGVQASRYLISMRALEEEKEHSELLRQCMQCVSDLMIREQDVKCHNLICSVHEGRSVAQKRIARLQMILNDANIWK